MKKMFKIFVLLLSGLTATNSFAQQLTEKWVSCFGGTGWDEGTGILFADSTYWSVANSNSSDGDVSFNHGSYDYWLLHVDNNGNLLSEKTFGGNYADGGFLDIKQMGQEKFYIAAQSWSTNGDISFNPWPNDVNLWILQVNKQGDILWETMAGGSGQDELRDMRVTSDGGVLLLALSNSHDGDVTDHHGNYDLWLLKMDSTGQKQWSKSFGGTGLEEGGSVIQTTDGGYMVVGETDGRGGGNYDSTCNHHNPASGFLDLWVVKLDAEQNIEWQQCYGGTYSDHAFNVIEQNDGYIILGSTMSNDGDVSGLHDPPGNSENSSDIWVFKIDKTGNLLWQKCLGGSNNDDARNIFTTTDGGYMIVGSTRSSDGDVTGYHGIPGYPNYTYDIWFVKIDSIGNLLWQYCYGGVADEFLYRGVIQKSDWDYVLAIGTETTEWRCYFGTNLRPDFRIVELYDSTVGVKEVRPVQEDLITLYPNPSGNTIKLKFPGNKLLNTASVSIYDVNGKIMLSLKPKSLITTINTSRLKSGLYFVKIKNQHSVITKKIVIR